MPDRAPDAVAGRAAGEATVDGVTVASGRPLEALGWVARGDGGAGREAGTAECGVSGGRDGPCPAFSGLRPRDIG